MNSVEYDTDCYLTRLENAEREYEERYRDILDEVKSESYFTVMLDDFVDLATPEEIVRLYSLCVKPIDSFHELERDNLSNVVEALEMKQWRGIHGSGGTDEYITEEAFQYIPARLLPKLRKIEAERRLEREYE